MRKLFSLLLVAAMGIAVAGTASAATFDAANSSLTIRRSGLPPVGAAGNPGGAVSSSGPVVTEFASPTKAFGPVNIDLADSLFTGVPQIVDLRLSGLDKPAGTGNAVLTAAGGPGGGFGGIAPLSGNSTICVFSCAFGIQVQVPLTVVGAGGVLFSTALGAPLTVANLASGWTTGAAVISGINTELVSFGGNTCAPVTCPVTTLANGTGIGVYATQVTLSGTNNLNGTGAGSITLVTPVLTNSVAGALPLFAIQTLVFTPEPGTLLLLGAGVAGLAVVGRRKMRG
jgi:hypothetical protein